MLWIKIQNDGTGTEKIGNYDYQVGLTDRILEEGRVEWHPRIEGWRGLVRRLLKASIKNEVDALRL